MNPNLYPGIKAAALAIAYDNGGIHQGRSEKQMLKELGAFLDRQPIDLLAPIDAWLTSLSDDDLDTVCAGEQTDREVLLDVAPLFTDRLINDYFNEVC